LLDSLCLDLEIQHSSWSKTNIGNRLIAARLFAELGKEVEKIFASD
jgi:hypothetical protein